MILYIGKRKRKQRCGTCGACSKDDCAECVNCKDMVVLVKRRSVVCNDSVKTYRQREKNPGLRCFMFLMLDVW